MSAWAPLSIRLSPQLNDLGNELGRTSGVGLAARFHCRELLLTDLQKLVL